MKRNRTESQSQAIGRAIAAHKAAKENKRINSQMTREFGAPEFFEFQGTRIQEEQAQIQEFLDNNKGNTERFQKLPYANGYRVSNNPY
jgi:hypothetical protein